MTGVLLLAFVLQTFAYAAPVLFAALGEVFSERVGVINIGLEGLMLVGALSAVVASAAASSALAGVLAAFVAGGLGGLLFAAFAVGLARDQVIVGTTLNFLAAGLTGVWYRAWTSGGTKAQTAPALRPLFGESGTSLNALTLLALLLVPLGHFLLVRTRLGVLLRATGEVPEAAAASGARVNRIRAVVCALTGGLCGLGGAALSIGISNTFTENMTGGRGFIALAIVVFGRWSPVGAWGAALLFAAADVAQARLQASGAFHIPYPVFLAIPYVLTLVALAIRGGSVRAPAALGVPFEQG